MSIIVLKNQNSYSTFSLFVIIKRLRFKEKKEMALDSRVNPQWTEVEGLTVVTLVVKAEAQA